MVKYEFNLSRENSDRVFALKKEMGMDDMTGNEFACWLLTKELYRLHPETVQFDEDGIIIKRKGE